MKEGPIKKPRIVTAAPVMYISPMVSSLEKRFKKLELEYIGITTCKEKIKAITVMVYILCTLIEEEIIFDIISLVLYMCIYMGR